MKSVINLNDIKSIVLSIGKVLLFDTGVHIFLIRNLILIYKVIVLLEEKGRGEGIS